MINKKFLRNILTTASTLAITMGASEVMASALTTTGTPSNLSSGGNLNAGWASGDNITFTGNNQILDIDTTDTVTGVYNGSHTGCVINVSAGATLGEVAASSGSSSGGTTVAVNITDGTNFTMNNSNLQRLGNVSIGTGSGAAATLNISPSAGEPTLYGNFNGSASGLAILNLTGSAQAQGGFGNSTALNALTLSASAMLDFQGAVLNANTITLGSGASLKTTGTTVTGNIKAAANGNGTLAILKATTVAGNIGTSAAALNGISFGANYALTTSGTMDVYAPVTTSTNNTGKLIVTGGTATFHQNVGAANTGILSQITINSGATLGFNAYAQAISVYGAIDGDASGHGTLLLNAVSGNTTAFHNIDIESNVGGNYPVSAVTVSVASGSTVTFHGNVSSSGNIDASGSGSTVSFNGNVTSSAGNFLTSTSSFSAVSGNVNLQGAASSMTLGNNLSAGGNITVGTGGIHINGNTLTTTSAATITGDIKTTGNAGTGGTVPINGNNITLAGSAGANGNSLTAINFATNNSLTIDATAAARDIYSPITTGAGDGTGTVIVAGGANSVTFHGTIGAGGAALHNLTINASSTAIIDSAVASVHTSIDGASDGVGILKTSGATALEFDNAIGATHYLATIDTSASTAGTITFDGTVNATTITTGAAAVTFSSNVNYNSTTLNAGAGLVTFGASGMPGAINLANAASQVVVTAGNGGAFASTVTNTTGTARQGVLGISTHDMTLQYGLTIAGSGTTSIAAIELLDAGRTITLNSNTVFASITTANTGQGTLAVTNNGMGVTNSTVVGNIGSNTAALSSVSIGANSLTMDSTSGSVDVYAPVTGTGGLIATGGNTTTFHQNVGANGTSLSQLTINNGTTLSFDASAQSISVYGSIDGDATDHGTLLLTSTVAHAINIENNVGGNYPLNAVTANVITGGTLTFYGHVTAFNNIDVSGSSTIVNFGGNVTSIAGNFLTNSNNSAVSGNVTLSDGSSAMTLAGACSVHGNISVGSGGINLNGNLLTITGASTVHGNIQTTGGGTFRISGNDVVLVGSAGTGGNSLTAIDFATNNTLSIDATATSRHIYSPITTSAGDGTGTFYVDSTGQSLTFHGAIGANGASLANLAISNGSIVIIDSATASVHTSIDGAGTLKTSGATSLTFNNDIGSNTGLSSIDTTSSTAGTITFSGSVRATTVTTGAAPVIFSGVPYMGSVTTGTGLVTFSNFEDPDSIILGNTASQVNLAGGGIFGGTITNNTGSAGNGIIGIISNDHEFNSTTVGASGNGTLNAVKFMSDQTLNLENVVTIHANILTNSGGTGSLHVDGSSTIYGGIGGNGAALSTISVDSSGTLTVTGNIYSGGTTLNNNATLRILGGTSGSPQSISTTINGSGAGNGIIAIGKAAGASPGTAGSVLFNSALGGANAVHLLTIADSATPWTANTNSNVTLPHNASFSGANGGIRIGDGASFLFNGGANITLSNGASVDGTGTNHGIMTLANANAMPCAVGSNTPLQSVILYGIQGNGGIATTVGQDINALNIDLQGNSRILLDGHVTNSHVTGTRTMNSVVLPTGIISSDGSGTAAANGVYGGAYVEFAGAANTTTAVGNLAVPIKFNGAGTLSIAGATPSYSNDTTVTFWTNGILSVQDGGTLYGVASLGIDPIGTVTNAGNATFASNIGANGQSIEAFNPSGYGTVTFPSNTAVYTATTNIGSATYAIGNNTVTVNCSGAATLSGNIVINANYTGTDISGTPTPQIVLDLSSATGLTDSATSITLNVVAYNVTPTHAVSIIKMINLPNGATLSVEPTVTSLDGKWVADGNTGQISYYALPVAAAAPITQTKSSSLGGGIGYSPQGASGTQVTQAISGILPGNTAVTVDTAPQILNATNVPATPGGRGALAEAVLLNSTTPMSTQNIMVASTTPNVSSTLSDAMNGSSTPKDIAQGLAQITLVGGPSVAQAASNAIKPPDLDTQNTVNLTNAGAKLLSYYQSLPLSTIPNLPTHEINSASKALPQPTTGAGAPTLPKVGGPSVALSDDEQEAPGEEAEALAYGAAAGSSPYEKFGVWGLINGGIAHQKMLKGNSGFKSVSKGATIGVDTMISEKSIIGLTISNSMNNIKMRDTNAGDKTSISSWIATLYGSRQLKNNWFIRGSALFNRTHINSKSLRPVRGGYGIAQARYNAMSYGGEVAVGFNHIFKNGIIATPNVGFRVIHNNQLSYSEKGNTIFNNSLKQNAINNYSVIAGLSVSKGFSKYGIDFTPEAHVNMQYGVNTKTPQGTFVSSITPNQISNFISTKSSKFSSTYGVSLTGASDRLECGVTADMSISQKYVGYQGSLKLKVKF